jgi:competence protein ComEA
MALIRHIFIVLGLVLSLSAFAADSVDINTASAQDIAQVMNGVGPRKAEAIVEHRSTYGPFSNVDELTEVRGIGPSIVERNRKLVSVSQSAN